MAIQGLKYLNTADLLHFPAIVGLFFFKQTYINTLAATSPHLWRHGTIYMCHISTNVDTDFF